MLAKWARALAKIEQSYRNKETVMFRRTFLSTAAALTCLAMLGAGPAAAEPKTIAIANFGEHPQLNAVADGFKAEILASGMAEGTDVVFTLDHVNFDTTLLPQMISKIEALDQGSQIAVKMATVF